MTGGAAPGGGSGLWPHHAGAVRALERAADATVGALRHLDLAGDVEWSGLAARGYRAALDEVLDGVRRAHVEVDRAATAMAEYAVTQGTGLLPPADGLVRPLVPAPRGWSDAP